MVLRFFTSLRFVQNDMEGGAPFVLRTFPPLSRGNLPFFHVRHTPLTSLRSFAPLSLCERGGGVL